MSADTVVVMNAEEQRALWPADLPVPAGWTVVFGAADRQSCVDHVDATWPDIRPLSTRRPA